MKSYKSLLHTFSLGLLAVGGMCLSAGLTSCSDDVDDSAFYTFTGHTVASYCAEDPRLSIFNSLLAETGINGLLSTYGHYTLFAPTDEVMNEYFAAKGVTYESMSLEEKQNLVYDHIIKSEGIDYSSDVFEEGTLAESSMSNNYLTISFLSDATGTGLVIYVNKDVPVIEKDIEVHNGVVHIVGNVIEPSTDYLTDVIEQDGRFTIFTEALRLTGIDLDITKERDENYVAPEPENEYSRVPVIKRIGFTLFAEPDAVMKDNGINNIDDLVAYAEQYYGTEARNDYENEANALHKFVAYHLLNRQMATNSFLYTGAATVQACMNMRAEYYETLLTYRMMEIKAGNHINQLSDGTAVDIDELTSNLQAVNGFAHTLKSMLVYDEDKMVNDVLNKRIRFDFYAPLPELVNNNIRWQLTELPDGVTYTIPKDFCEGLTLSDETSITLMASDTWTNHQADEMKLYGWYDFTLRMLPMPPGSYEVRIGYRQEDWRGIAQLFVDDQIQGIPRDLRITGDDPQVGWVADSDSPLDAEYDKAMRNRGYMKAPASIYASQLGGSLRTDKRCLRIIVGQFTWQEYGYHTLRAKNVFSPTQEFHGDYIEIIPTSQIDREDIY